MKKKIEYPLSSKERITIIIVSVLFIGVFAYLALKGNQIHEKDLKSFETILVSNPQYFRHEKKTGYYQGIAFKAYLYNKEFSISGTEYLVSDYKSILKEIKAGDKIILKLKDTNSSELNSESFWSKRNRVFGVSKDGEEYLDLKRLSQSYESDSKWAYIFVIWGLVMLPYGFIKSKPLIDLDKAIFIFSVISLILIMLFG